MTLFYKKKCEDIFKAKLTQFFRTLNAVASPSISPFYPNRRASKWKVLLELQNTYAHECA